MHFCIAGTRSTIILRYHPAWRMNDTRPLSLPYFHLLAFGYGSPFSVSHTLRFYAVLFALGSPFTLPVPYRHSTLGGSLSKQGSKLLTLPQRFVSDSVGLDRYYSSLHILSSCFYSFFIWLFFIKIQYGVARVKMIRTVTEETKDRPLSP